MKQTKLKKWLAGILVLCMVFTTGALETFAANSGNEAVEKEDPGKGRLAGNIPPEFYGGKASRAITEDTVYVHDGRFAEHTIKNGIDVSKWNGKIDWNKVKAAGIDFVFVRVAYRGYGESGSLSVDPTAQANLKGAIAAGIPVGAYIFSQAITETEARQEADYTIQQLKNYQIDMPIIMDVEYIGSSEGRLYDAHLTRAEQTAVCMAFCERVEELGYEPMVYANKSMLCDKMNADVLSQDYKIWLAHYISETDYEGDYHFWQYTSKGSVNGISGNVDMNFWYMKEEEPGLKISDFTMSEKTDTSVKLNWAASETAEGYEIVRKISGENYAKLADVSQSEITEYTDETLKMGNRYFYKIRSYRTLENGEKVYGNYSTVLTNTIALNNTTLTGKAAGFGKIGFTWEKAEGVSGYQLQRVTSTGTSTVASISNADTLSYTLSELNSDTNYQFRIRTYKMIGGGRIYSSWSPTITVKTSGPVIGVVKQNKVYVRTNATSASQVVTTVNKGTQLTVTGNAGNWYRILITVNGNTRTACIPKMYTTLVTPVGKTVLSGSAAAFDSTKLTWKKVSGASGYVIQRYNNPKKRYDTVKTITSGSTVSCIDGSLNASTTFRYRIRAFKAVNGTRVYGPYSDVKAIKTKAPRKGVITGTLMNVRSGAGLKYSTVAKLKKGTVVTVTGSRGGWYQLSISVKRVRRTAYISKKYLRLY